MRFRVIILLIFGLISVSNSSFVFERFINIDEDTTLKIRTEEYTDEGFICSEMFESDEDDDKPERQLELLFYFNKVILSISSEHNFLAQISYTQLQQLIFHFTSLPPPVC